MKLISVIVRGNVGVREGFFLRYFCVKLQKKMRSRGKNTFLWRKYRNLNIFYV